MDRASKRLFKECTTNGLQQMCCNIQHQVFEAKHAVMMWHYIQKRDDGNILGQIRTTFAGESLV